MWQLIKYSLLDLT